MPEETKQALESLSKSANKLTPDQLRRLGDIAYGYSPRDIFFAISSSKRHSSTSSLLMIEMKRLHGASSGSFSIIVRKSAIS